MTEPAVINAFLMTSDATRPADLPDWLTALLEGDRQEDMSHELITADTLLYPSNHDTTAALPTDTYNRRSP